MWSEKKLGYQFEAEGRGPVFWVCVLPFEDLNSSQIGKVDITTLFY